MLVLKLIPLLAAFIKAEIAFPSITLPWGTYQATKYDADGDVSEQIEVSSNHISGLLSVRFSSSRFKTSALELLH